MSGLSVSGQPLYTQNKRNEPIQFELADKVDTNLMTPFEDPYTLSKNVYEPVSPIRNQSLCDAIFESENSSPSPSAKAIAEKPSLDYRTIVHKTIVVTEEEPDEEIVKH